MKKKFFRMLGNRIQLQNADFLKKILRGADPGQNSEEIPIWTAKYIARC